MKKYLTEFLINFYMGFGNKLIGKGKDDFHFENVFMSC
jgi:hypothetical protein